VNLLAALVDDAGLFPPESLPMAEALARHRADEAAGHPMLSHRFLCPASRLDELRAAWAEAGRGAEGPLRLGVIVDTGVDGIDTARDEVAEEPALALEMLEVPAPSVDTVGAVLEALAGCSEAAFVEGPRAPDWVKGVASAGAVGAAGLRGAKVRCGGARADLFPSPEELAAFVCACFEHGVPFKATAGLHHPLRARYRLTYEPDSPSGTMYGFLNLFLAAAFLRQGMGDADAARLLEERDPASLAFERGGGVVWRGHRLGADALVEARARGLGSFGSCSFEEPIGDLASLHLL